MKLQTVQHADGSLEIRHKLSLDWLENCQDSDPLLDESSIVWLEDIAALPYVREMTVSKCKSRRGPLRQGKGSRIAGWYDSGQYVWGGPDTEPVTLEALRVSVFSKDESTPLKSIDFRSKPGRSWIVARLTSAPANGRVSQRWRVAAWRRSRLPQSAVGQLLLCGRRIARDENKSRSGRSRWQHEAARQVCAGQQLRWDLEGIVG
jgi:hypothetical protein